MSHYIPLTPTDEARMLAVLGLGSGEELFGTIPEAIRSAAAFSAIGAEPLAEPEVVAHMADLAAASTGVDARLGCRRWAWFLGGGVYDHYVPAVVRHLASRSEFFTAYTPYQAEASQGTLQATFEYQSLIAALTGMDVSNASHYDGASALAEAALMAAAATGREEVLVSEAVNPRHRAVLATYARAAGLTVSTIATGPDGRTLLPPAACLSPAAAIVLGYPNALGVIEDLASFGAARGKALLVVDAYPIALGLLRSPGSHGADIVTGDGINLGGGLSLGGPGLGIMAVTSRLLRKMPGRIVGETVDADGKVGYVLTIQAREQHIRREKASSNICTNQALVALQATIYLSLLGRTGLRRLAEVNLARAHTLARRLEALGLRRTFSGPFFNEFAVTLPCDPVAFVEAGLAEGIMVGHPLGRDFPGHDRVLLVAVTEKRTPEEIDRYVQLAKRHLAL